MADISAAVWATNLLGAVVYVVAGYLLVSKVFPILRDVLSVLKDEIADAIMGLMSVAVIVFVIAGILDKLAAIGHEFMNYFAILKPLVELFTKVLPYLEYLVLAALVISAVGAFKKK